MKLSEVQVTEAQPVQSVTLKIRKKANYPVQRLLENIFLMNYMLLSRGHKREEEW